MRGQKWQYAVRKATIGRHAVRKVDVILMVMDCDIEFIRFRIPDQVLYLFTG